MARQTLSDKGVAALKPRATRYFYPDPELVGHYVRVSLDGRKVFYAQSRGSDGKQKWVAIGPADTTKIDEARDQARGILRRLRAGLTAREEIPDTFGAVAENFLVRHVRAQGLRTAGDVERLLRKCVLPLWGNRPFAEIRRGDISRLLDHIEDKHGARQADVVLAILRKMATWQENRDDDYVSPYRRGMKRQSGKAQARSRILADDEIKAVWQAAEAGGTFGAFVQIALLTGQRRDKVASMRWADMALDGTWTIPVAEREKGTAGELVLPPVALEIINAQPRMGENPFVFAGRASGHINGYTKGKARLDKASGTAGWALHDLRRTARSLMSRAGVRPDIAERVMGHAIPGVEGVYDRHSYRDEKADALRRLAGLIENIVRPVANVRPLRGGAR
jgi:integrase